MTGLYLRMTTQRIYRECKQSVMKPKAKQILDRQADRHALHCEFPADVYTNNCLYWPNLYMGNFDTLSKRNEHELNCTKENYNLP